MQEIQTILYGSKANKLYAYDTIFKVYENELDFQEEIEKYSRFPCFYLDNWLGYNKNEHEEIMKIFRNGDTSFTEKFNSVLLRNRKILTQGEIKRTKIVSAQQGYMPNVAAVLANSPKCFYKPQVRNIKSPIINIYYDIICPARITTEDREKALSKLFLKICELEMSGYRVKINLIQAHASGNCLEGYCFPLKMEYEKLNITRIAYPMINTFFLRKLGFAWYRSFCQEKRNGVELRGYGYPIYCVSETLRNALIRTLKKKKEKAVYVCMDTNLDSLVEEIKKGEN